MAEPHLELDWPAYAEEIGRRVAAVREIRKVSQTELANVVGLSRSHLQNIERSRSSGEGSVGNPSIRKLVEIAQALAVPVTLLLPQDVPLAEYQTIGRPLWDRLKDDLEPAVLERPLPRQVRPSTRIG